MTVIERRLKLLKLEGLGFSQPEIIHSLSKEFNCTPRTLYFDFERRGSWQPQIQQIGDSDMLLLKTLNRFEAIYKKASLIMLSSRNESVQLGALKLMAEMNSRIVDVSVLAEVEGRLSRLEGQKQ